MDNEIKRLEEEFQTQYEKAKTSQDLEALRVRYLGRKSALSQLFSRLAGLSPEAKGLAGQRLNQLKERFLACLATQAEGAAAKEAKLDVTFPAAAFERGSMHILSQVNREICSIFERLGFIVVEGKEIEDEWHNFQALNFPPEHPSRDAFDTFYLDLPETGQGRMLLRCHTSPSQIRVMQKYKPPLAVISPGRVYRPDEVDATHSYMFHQIEGFCVDTDISFAHLKGVLDVFAREFFGRTANVRMRPHFFPFTEPSAEADVSCFNCKGKASSKSGAADKCRVCKGKGWLEILGCGMIHPNVLKACGINPKTYRGFAFGMGVDRIAMLKYGIEDIRLLYENDVRFLNQF